MKNISIFLFCIVLFSTGCKTTSTVDNKTTTTSAKINKKELTEKQRLDYDYYFFNANKESILGNFELAATLFTKCIEVDPANPAAIYELAKINNYAGKKEKALEYSGKAANLDEKNIWYQLLYADLLFEKKKYSEAANVYQRLVKNYPNKIDLYMELAETQVYAGKLNDAIATYDKIEEKIGVSEDATMQKMKIYNQQKNTEKALKELNKLIKANPKEPKYYGMLGEIYQNSGQKEKAFESFNELLKIDPDNPYVRISLANYYFDQKQDEKGLEQYKLAFNNTRLDIDTKVKILLSYYALSEKKSALKNDAMQLCEALVKTHPDEAKAHAVYGDFLYRDKKLKEARDAFRKANELDNTKYVIWNQVLIINSELNDMQAMLTDSKKCMEYFPSQPLAYFFNGIANIQNKNYTEAISVLKEGKELVVENPALETQFYSSLGDAYNNQKKYKESDEAYEKALKIDAKNVYVLNNYAYYLSMRKEKLERAEEMSRQSLEIEPTSNSYQDTYGWILYVMGKYSDAKIWIEKAMQNGAENNPVILEHYGDILYKLGDTTKAIEFWEKAKTKGDGSEFLDKKIKDKKLYE